MSPSQFGNTAISGVAVWHFPAFSSGLARRRIARLRRKDPDWLVFAVMVVAMDLLLATIAWIIVDLALT